MNYIRIIVISLIVFVALVVAAPACFNIYAEDGTPEKGDKVTQAFEIEPYKADAPLDNEKLFESYVEEQFNVKSAPAESRSRGSKLTGLNKTIYNLLRPEIKKIADGERASTVFEITVSDLGLLDSTWTAEDLGVDTVAEDGVITGDAYTALLAKLNIKVSSIVNALLADCPYDLYWFDKVSGVAIEDPEITTTYNGDEWVLSLSKGVTLSFAVAQNYSDGEYTVSTVNAVRVQHAVSKAAAIVAEVKDKTDYEKLVDYREKICALVSYDTATANSESPIYGDSWQLISVFDEDKDTNVVCEGYSKAFQYLCDLTRFEGDINCISVSGNMYGGTGAGAHMWNIVNMEDNYNYLVDVTNCDEDSVGYPGSLFLAGYSTMNGNNEYGFNCNESTIIYSYDTNTIETFDSDELSIRESSYEYQNPSLWTTYRAESFTGGDGTESDPYEISCGEELALLAYYVNNNKDPYVSSCYELTSDIDLGEHLWVPIGGTLIGSYTTVFKGQFNGNAHAIKNMKIGDGCAGNYIGLFGTTDGALIEKLRIEDAAISVKNSYSFVTGFAFEGFVCAGVLVGEVGESEIHNCSIINMNCSVQSNASVFFGGLAGHFAGGVATVSSVSGTASLMSDKGIEAGGLFGDCLNASISKCDFRGTLYTDNTNAPVLDGEWSGIEFGHQVGGLIGRGSQGYISLDNCYAHVKIQGKSYEFMCLGGLFGFINLNAEGERLSCHNTYCKCEMARREYNDTYSGYQGLFASITEGHFTDIRLGANGAVLDFENVGFFDDDWFWKLDDYNGPGDEKIPTTKYKLEGYSTKNLFEDVLNYSDEIWKIQDGYYPVLIGESSVGLPDDFLNEWLFYDSSLLSEMTMSGKCGDNAYWKYTNGVLTISGEGSVYDYHDNETGQSCAPWKDLQYWTRKIIIDEGITGIGRNSFIDNYSFKEVYLPSTLLQIDEGAFLWDYRLDKVYYAGTEANWQKVAVGGLNDDLLQANFVYHKCQSQTLTAHEAHDANCTESGNNVYWNCNICGRLYADANAENEIMKDDVVIPALGHDYKEIEGSATAATCMKDGKEADQKCSQCGDVIEGAIIEKLAHQLKHIDGVDPTCEESGRVECWECSACKGIFSNSEGTIQITEENLTIEALKHKVEIVPGKPATCTEFGMEDSAKCGRCGVTLWTGKTIPPLQHKWGDWTELDENQHQRVCENDSEHIQTATHKWDEGVITTEPTTTETGIKTFTCNDCKATRTETIPMKDVDPITPSDETADQATIDKTIPTVNTSKIKTTANIKKKQMQVKFPVSDAADNFRIQYRVAGKNQWTSDWSAGTDNYAIRGLKKSSLCEFRIAGYVKQEDGSWARGEWSKTSYRYMSAVPAKTIKAGKKNLTLTWVKDKKASGYQVQYSLKKNMAGAKTVNVKGASKTRCTIPKLKSGKRYYVKVRPIKKKAGKTYLGILSGVKAVKVR